MTNSENVTGPAPDTLDEYVAGQRSITQRATKSRFDILREKKARGQRNRPFIFGGLGILAVLMTVIGVVYGFH